MKTHILDVAATENNDNDDGNLRAPFLHPSLRFAPHSDRKMFLGCAREIVTER
jgi:hypothetical protein